jgi:hypothetical protein
MTISHEILLRVRNILGKICRKNQNTLLSSVFLFLENRTIYEIKSKTMVDPEAADENTAARCMLDK